MESLLSQVIAVWQGDFSTNTHFWNFQSKYLMVPDWRATLATNPEEIEYVMSHEQVTVSYLSSGLTEPCNFICCSNVWMYCFVQGGAEEWLIIDKHMVDPSGRTCNKIGSDLTAFLTQENRCYQKAGS